MTMPTRDNRYQLPSWPPTDFTIDLWNETFGDLADRIAAREDLEASFETLMAQGIQASLDYIQVNVAPQIATLQQSISLAQQQIDQIIVGGSAPNALKLGGREAAWYASAQAMQDALQDASVVVDTKLADYLRADQKNVGNGVAPLGADSKVPLANLPALTTTATVGAAVAAANGKSTPDDGDFFAGVAAGSSAMFKTTWANIKSALDVLFYRKAAVDAAVGGRVAKTGDTLTGNFTIEKTYPLMQYSNGGNKWWTYYDTGDSAFKFSYNEAVRFQVNSDGHIWCAAFGSVHDRIEQRALAWANDRVSNLNSRWVSRGEYDTSAQGQWREAPAGAAITGSNGGYNSTSVIRFCYRYFQLFDPVRGWITAHNA